MVMTSNQATTDGDMEKELNIDFAKETRKNIKWMGANNIDVMAITRAQVAGVIGKRINIQSRIKDKDELNEQIEEFISEWSEDENCEVTGRWHFDGALRSMVEFTIKEGGFLIRHHYSVNWNIPYRFELLSVSEIDTSKQDGAFIVNGIRKDNYGRPIGVFLFNDKEKITSSEISMDELIYFSPVWISLSQYTAVSKLSTVLPTIEKLDEYAEAEVAAAKIRAKNGRILRSTMYDTWMQILKDMAKSSDKSSAKYEIEAAMKVMINQGIKQEGFIAIPKDDEVVPEAAQSDSVFQVIAQTSQNRIAASQGMSSMTVYQDPSKASYSSNKTAMAFTEINWDIEFDNLERRVINKILAKAIDAGVTIGKLKINGFFENPRQFIKLEYMRVASIDIEPSKTADANTKNLENGFMSKREMAKKRGKNIQDVIRERIEEDIIEQQLKEKMYKEANLEIPEPKEKKTQEKESNPAKKEIEDEE